MALDRVSRVRKDTSGVSGSYAKVILRHRERESEAKPAIPPVYDRFLVATASSKYGAGTASFDISTDPERRSRVTGDSSGVFSPTSRDPDPRFL